MTGADFQQFSVVRDELIKLLNSVQYRTRNEIYEENTEKEERLGVEP